MFKCHLIFASVFPPLVGKIETENSFYLGLVLEKFILKGVIMDCNIMIVKIDARREKSTEVQEVLSKFGHSIKMRLGLHETVNDSSDEGVLILQLAGGNAEMLDLDKALNKLESVQAKMVIL